MVPILY